MSGAVTYSSSVNVYEAGWPDLSQAVRSHEETVVRLNDIIAQLSAKRDRIVSAIAELRKDVFEVASAAPAETNGHAKKRGRPKKVGHMGATGEEDKKPRRLGIAGDVVSYLSGKEGVAVETIAESINCTKQQVSQVLTAGKKKGRFKIVGRGVWALA